MASIFGKDEIITKSQQFEFQKRYPFANVVLEDPEERFMYSFDSFDPEIKFFDLNRIRTLNADEASEAKILAEMSERGCDYAWICTTDLHEWNIEAVKFLARIIKNSKITIKLTLAASILNDNPITRELFKALTKTSASIILELGANGFFLNMPSVYLFSEMIKNSRIITLSFLFFGEENYDVDRMKVFSAAITKHPFLNSLSIMSTVNVMEANVWTVLFENIATSNITSLNLNLGDCGSLAESQIKPVDNAPQVSINSIMERIAEMPKLKYLELIGNLYHIKSEVVMRMLASRIAKSQSLEKLYVSFTDIHSLSNQCFDTFIEELEVNPKIRIDFRPCFPIQISDIFSKERQAVLRAIYCRFDLSRLYDALEVSEVLLESHAMNDYEKRLLGMIVSFISAEKLKHWREICQITGFLDKEQISRIREIMFNGLVSFSDACKSLTFAKKDIDLFKSFNAQLNSFKETLDASSKALPTSPTVAFAFDAMTKENSNLLADFVKVYVSVEDLLKLTEKKALKEAIEILRSNRSVTYFKNIEENNATIFELVFNSQIDADRFLKIPSRSTNRNIARNNDRGDAKGV